MSNPFSWVAIFSTGNDDLFDDNDSSINSARFCMNSITNFTQHSRNLGVELDNNLEVGLVFNKLVLL